MVSFNQRPSGATARIARAVGLAVVVGALGVSACAANSIHDLYTSLDSTGFRRRTQFYTDSEKIYCLGTYSTERNDVTFQAIARLVKDETGALADTPIAVGEIAPGISHGTLQFTIAPPKPPPTAVVQGTEPFPVGRYRCEYYTDSLGFTVSADPRKASAENGIPGYKAYPSGQCPPGATCVEYDVLYPVCPVTYAAPTVRCGGFYPNGAKCRGPSAGVVCTCPGTTASDAWVCQ